MESAKVRDLNVLTFTTLYPNRVRPNHGIFVETRLRHLVRMGGIRATVLAPVPWFPVSNALFGEYGRYAAIPRIEERCGITIHHPRYPVLPKIGMSIAPLLLAHAMKAQLRALMGSGLRFDVIDAHYFYPDGVAAVMLGRAFRLPVIVTARGSDLNIIPQHWLPRLQIQWAASHAASIITVSDALRLQIENLGIASDRVTVLRNGVDLELFTPMCRSKVRHELGLAQPTLLAVGNLVPLKGHDIVIRALQRLPDARLVIVGAGPQRESLERLAESTGVRKRVEFLGVQSQERLVKWYSAADVLVLASSSEGWPNVLLEAMACGTPVVAAGVGGVPEVIRSEHAGRLMHARDHEACADAVAQVLKHGPDRAATRRYAEGFSWEATSRGQIELLRSAAGIT